MGPQGCHRHAGEDGPASGRHLPLPDGGGRRLRDLGQNGLPRDHAARPDRLHQLVLGRGRRYHAASDGTAAEFKGFSLSLSAKDEADARRLFAALSEGGQVHQPLVKTFFSPAFGMVQDKFGMGWMVIVEQAAAKAA